MSKFLFMEFSIFANQNIIIINHNKKSIDLQQSAVILHDVWTLCQIFFASFIDIKILLFNTADRRK